MTMLKLLGALVALLALTYLDVQPGLAASSYCMTRDEAITVIAHKADVEYGGRSASKWRIWQIADRESGLSSCWPNGSIKISYTNDHSLLQLNPGGVWRNCGVNPYCNRPDLIDDPYLQIDVMLNYYLVYGDLCPWNPDPRGNYMPGCGYR